MEYDNKRIMIYPGTFDPLTQGHTNIIERGLNFCDKLIVAIAADTNKIPLFSMEERKIMVQEMFANEPRIHVTSFEGLLVDYAKSCGAQMLLRGLRAVSDYEYEFQVALMNKKLLPSIETVFLIADFRWLYVSSTIIKTVASLGGDVTGLVPDHVITCLKAHFQKSSNKTLSP